MKTLSERITRTIKNWWVSLLLGILYIILGIWLLAAPLSSYFILSVIFAVSLLVSGILEITFSISNRDNISSWGWYLAGGIIELLLGIFLIAFPIFTMELLPFIVAFWLMFSGFSGIGFSMDLQRYGSKGWGWYLALGILVILASIAIIWRPIIGAISIIYMLSFTFFVIGIFRIIFSFELRSLYKRNQDLYHEL